MKTLKKIRINFLCMAFMVAGLPLNVHASVFHDSPVSRAILSNHVVVVATPVPMFDVAVDYDDSACSLQLHNSLGNLVQDAAIVNLNQPASCLPLRVGQVVEVQQSLAVTPIAEPLPIYNVRVTEKDDSFQFSVTEPSPFNLPVAALVMAMLAVVSEFKNYRRSYKQSLSIGRQDAKQLLTLSQLQVFRC